MITHCNLHHHIQYFNAESVHVLYVIQQLKPKINLIRHDQQKHNLNQNPSGLTQSTSINLRIIRLKDVKSLANVIAKRYSKMD